MKMLIDSNNIYFSIKKFLPDFQVYFLNLMKGL